MKTLFSDEIAGLERVKRLPLSRPTTSGRPAAAPPVLVTSHRENSLPGTILSLEAGWAELMSHVGRLHLRQLRCRQQETSVTLAAASCKETPQKETDDGPDKTNDKEKALEPAETEERKGEMHHNDHLHLQSSIQYQKHCRLPDTLPQKLDAKDHCLSANPRHCHNKAFTKDSDSNAVHHSQDVNPPPPHAHHQHRHHVLPHKSESRQRQHRLTQHPCPPEGQLTETSKSSPTTYSE
ncbi:unnamed protein product [Protopolystoma xenopodis]|uniref:Uncharacterized protein n=1 Tax=Protopolystoma xenopodis TaxID=117903 RepID=A0A3S5AF38_9PLAT|nr:unnamed protein product [Protopolystoma xenopodis]